MLQNLLCSWKKKTQVVFFIFHLEQLLFSPYECPGLCPRAFIREKWKLLKMKKRNILHGFSFSINIANFEAFCFVFKLTKNLLFLKSDFSLVDWMFDFYDEIFSVSMQYHQLNQCSQAFHWCCVLFSKLLEAQLSSSTSFPTAGW